MLPDSTSVAEVIFSKTKNYDSKVFSKILNNIDEVFLRVTESNLPPAVPAYIVSGILAGYQLSPEFIDVERKSHYRDFLECCCVGGLLGACAGLESSGENTLLAQSIREIILDYFPAYKRLDEHIKLTLNSFLKSAIPILKKLEEYELIIGQSIMINLLMLSAIFDKISDARMVLQASFLYGLSIGLTLALLMDIIKMKQQT